MSLVAGTTPVIVGVGQVSERVGESGYSELSHMDLAGAALAAAIADAGAAAPLAAAIDTVVAIRQFEQSAEPPATMHRILVGVIANSQQRAKALHGLS